MFRQKKRFIAQSWLILGAAEESYPRCNLRWPEPEPESKGACRYAPQACYAEKTVTDIVQNDRFLFRRGRNVTRDSWR